MPGCHGNHCDCCGTMLVEVRERGREGGGGSGKKREVRAHPIMGVP